MSGGEVPSGDPLGIAAPPPSEPPGNPAADILRDGRTPRDVAGDGAPPADRPPADILRDATGASAPPPDSPHRDIVDRLPDEALLHAAAAARYGNEGDLKRAARALDLAERTGLPSGLVERNLDEVQARVDADERLEIIRRIPALRAFVAADPDNARLIRDDVETFGRIKSESEFVASLAARHPYWMLSLAFLSPDLARQVWPIALPIIGKDTGDALTRGFGGNGEDELTRAIAAADEIRLFDETKKLAAEGGYLSPFERKLLAGGDEERARLGRELTKALRASVEARLKVRALSIRPALREMREAGSLLGTLTAFAKDPIGIAWTTLAEASAAAIPVAITARFGGAARATAVVALTSYYPAYFASVIDNLQRRGIDVDDADALTTAFLNPDLMDEIYKRATADAAVAAVAGMATAGLVPIRLAPAKLPFLQRPIQGAVDTGLAVGAAELQSRAAGHGSNPAGATEAAVMTMLMSSIGGGGHRTTAGTAQGPASVVRRSAGNRPPEPPLASSTGAASRQDVPAPQSRIDGDAPTGSAHPPAAETATADAVASPATGSGEAPPPVAVAARQDGATSAASHPDAPDAATPRAPAAAPPEVATGAPAAVRDGDVQPPAAAARQSDPAATAARDTAKDAPVQPQAASAASRPDAATEPAATSGGGNRSAAAARRNESAPTAPRDAGSDTPETPRAPAVEAPPAAATEPATTRSGETRPTATPAKQGETTTPAPRDAAHDPSAPPRGPVEEPSRIPPTEPAAARGEEVQRPAAAAKRGEETSSPARDAANETPAAPHPQRHPADAEPSAAVPEPPPKHPSDQPSAVRQGEHPPAGKAADRDPRFLDLVRTTAQLETFGRIVEAARSLKTARTKPRAAKQLVRDILAENDLHTVYVSGAALHDLLGQLSRREGKEAAQIFARAKHTAKGDYAIPAATYLTELNPKAVDILTERIRLAPDGMSLRQTRDVLATFRRADEAAGGTGAGAPVASREAVPRGNAEPASVSQSTNLKEGDAGHRVAERGEAARQPGPSGRIYTAVFRVKLPQRFFRGSRAEHVRAANEALLRLMERDPEFAKMMNELGVQLRRTRSGKAQAKTPRGWTWHHTLEPGVLELVPRGQHMSSLFQKAFHPGARGGFSIWGKRKTPASGKK